MKIVIATGIYPPEIGGPAGYVKGLATELVKRGHEVEVVTYGDGRTERHPNFEVVVISRSGGALMRYARYAKSVYKMAKTADLVYAQGPVSEGLPAAVATLVARKPLALKIVGDFAWEQYMQSPLAETEPESLDEFLTHNHQGKIRVYEAVERWVAKRAKCIIVASYYMKGAVSQWRVNREKIHVIHNAITLQRVIGSRDEVRARLGLPTDVKLVLTAGRVIYWKRMDLAIRSVARLGGDWRLLIAGEGHMVKEWQQLAQEMGVKDRVVWLGRVDRDKLWEYMAAADVFVMPSCLETFSFVLLEALAQGCPAVISDRGGMLEIAERYPPLVTVSPFGDEEALAKAIADRRMPERADAIDLADFSANIMTDKTEAVLKVTAGNYGPK